MESTENNFHPLNKDLQSKRFFLFVLVFVSLFFLLVSAGKAFAASECYDKISGINRYERCRVDNGTSLTIYAEGCTHNCRVVTNNSGAALFIPTKTCSEWDSFLNRPPSGVTLANCRECRTFTGTSGYTGNTFCSKLGGSYKYCAEVERVMIICRDARCWEPMSGCTFVNIVSCSQSLQKARCVGFVTIPCGTRFGNSYIAGDRVICCTAP